MYAIYKHNIYINIYVNIYEIYMCIIYIYINRDVAIEAVF